MKIRFGVGIGPETGPESLIGVVDHLEASGVDSVWFSELVYSTAVDPFIGMAITLARTTRLKVGTSVAVLPGGRHPVLVAKQLSSLAAIGPKRVLPAFGLRSATPAERDIFTVPDGQRAAVFDESLQLLRSVLSQPRVDFTGRFFSVTGASVGTVPAEPLDIWLGGAAPAAFRRIGRLADGWLGSFLTPDEAGRARVAIAAAAAAAGREIEPDHFGINLAVAEGGLPDQLAAAIRARRPDVDPATLVAGDWDALHRQIDGYVAAGLSKFVIRPAGQSGMGEAGMAAFLHRFVTELLPRENH